LHGAGEDHASHALGLAGKDGSTLMQPGDKISLDHNQIVIERPAYLGHPALRSVLIDEKGNLHSLNPKVWHHTPVAHKAHDVKVAAPEATLVHEAPLAAQSASSQPAPAIEHAAPIEHSAAKPTEAEGLTAGADSTKIADTGGFYSGAPASQHASIPTHEASIPTHTLASAPSAVPTPEHAPTAPADVAGTEPRVFSGSSYTHAVESHVPPSIDSSILHNHNGVSIDTHEPHLYSVKDPDTGQDQLVMYGGNTSSEAFMTKLHEFTEANPGKHIYFNDPKPSLPIDGPPQPWVGSAWFDANGGFSRAATPENPGLLGAALSPETFTKQLQ
jgi:hypothetical protein